MTNNKKYYPWIVVALLWGVALLNYMDRQMLSTMKSAMMIDITELESATNFGRLMAVFLWIYGLMSPVAGMIADRINRKWLIVGSLFVWSFVTLMMGYSTDFNQIYILRAIMGVSEALYIPAGLSLITDYHQEKTRSLAVGIHMTGLYTGQALGGFGATIAGAYSWETTFHWFGIIGIAYSLVLILFLKEKKDHTVAKLDSEPGPKESPVKAAIKGMGMLFVNISFWIILLYYILATLLPIDKIIGRIYPLFGAALFFMALGILYVLLFDAYTSRAIVHLHDRDLFLHRSDCGRYLVRQMDSAECTGTHLYRFHRACLDHSGTPAVRIRRQFRHDCRRRTLFRYRFRYFRRQQHADPLPVRIATLPGDRLRHYEHDRGICRSDHHKTVGRVDGCR